MEYDHHFDVRLALDAQNVRLCDYEVELPEMLVIQAMNVVMELLFGKATLDAPDSDKWVEALNTDTVSCYGTILGR